MAKFLLRVFGVLMMVDGFSTLTFGRDYIRIFRLGEEESALNQAVDWLLARPGWQVRLAGAVEAAAGTGFVYGLRKLSG